jgi:membrane-associated protein
MQSLSGDIESSSGRGQDRRVMTFLTQLGAHLGPWLYVLAAGLAFGESALLIGMVLPGETALLIAGYYSHQGVLSLSIMLPLAVVAAIAGDSAGFEIGRRYGPQLRRSRFGRRIGTRRWDSADAFLHRHGGKAVFLGRLTAVLRALTPSMAGMGGMRYRTFFAWNALGGVLWGGGCVLLGWGFASALTQIGHYLTWAPLLLLSGVVFAVLLRRRHDHGRGREPAEAEAPEADPARSARV